MIAEEGSYQTDSNCSSLLASARARDKSRPADLVFGRRPPYRNALAGKPTDALTSPPSAHDVTVSHLMAAGAHLGHHPNLTLNTYQPYLAGRRGGVDIINLSLTLPSLRKACGVVRDISRDDGVIVFMGRKHLTKNPVWKAVKRLPGVGHAVTERWRPGSLTNAASVCVLCVLTLSLGVASRLTRRPPSGFLPQLRLGVRPQRELPARPRRHRRPARHD